MSAAEAEAGGLRVQRGFLDRGEAARWLARVRAEVPFAEHRWGGRTDVPPLPQLAFRYRRPPPAAAPAAAAGGGGDVVSVLEDLVVSVVEPRLGCRVEAVWCNLLRGSSEGGAGDHIDWHSDGYGQPIAVLSLGATRRLQYRLCSDGTDDGGATDAVQAFEFDEDIEGGSIYCVQPAYDAGREHRVPPLPAGAVGGDRVSLVFFCANDDDAAAGRADDHVEADGGGVRWLAVVPRATTTATATAEHDEDCVTAAWGGFVVGPVVPQEDELANDDVRRDEWPGGSLWQWLQQDDQKRHATSTSARQAGARGAAGSTPAARLRWRNANEQDHSHNNSAHQQVAGDQSDGGGGGGGGGGGILLVTPPSVDAASGQRWGSRYVLPGNGETETTPKLAFADASECAVLGAALVGAVADPGLTSVYGVGRVVEPALTRPHALTAVVVHLLFGSGDTVSRTGVVRIVARPVLDGRLQETAEVRRTWEPADDEAADDACLARAVDAAVDVAAAGLCGASGTSPGVSPDTERLEPPTPVIVVGGGARPERVAPLTRLGAKVGNALVLRGARLLAALAEEQGQEGIATAIRAEMEPDGRTTASASAKPEKAAATAT